MGNLEKYPGHRPSGSNNDPDEPIRPAAPNTTLASVLQSLKTDKHPKPGSPTIIQQLEKVVESGSECAVRTLYEGPPKCECCKNWVEEYPDDLRSSAEQEAESKSKALVVRMAKDHSDGKPLKLHSIIVQSPVIKRLLGEVFDGYKGITANLQRLVFRSPFHPFFHRWGVFTDLVNRQREEGQKEAAFSKLLYTIIELELRDSMAEIKDLRENRVITFEHLWALFEPGCHVYASVDGHDRFYLLESCEYMEHIGQRFLILRLSFIDWDGRRFGYVRDKWWPIAQFSGTRAITDLAVYPAEFLASRGAVEESLRQRGKKFNDLAGFHYKSYSGIASYKDGEKTVIKRLTDGRIIVDASSFFQEKPEEAIKLVPLYEFVLAPEVDVADEEHKVTRRYWEFRPDRDERAHPAIREAIRKTSSVKKGDETASAKETLSDEQLILCTHSVRGYSLKSKIMASFHVDSIQDISWNTSAFPNLMLKDADKDLILSFVESQTQHKPLFDDIIEGKGQGLIMLLVGNPGTGKTLTAEAIADKLRRPLYSLGAGELGQQAHDLESRLQSMLQLSQQWGAIVLLDECDIFLEKRSATNLDHNEIVAIFLRLLEYYPGMLILTSNRSEEIDPAFHSRIHFTLHYHDLHSAARKHIWNNLTTRSALECALTEEQYTWLSAQTLNGRQIKNIVKMSLLLADKQGKKLDATHIRTVLRATKEIDVTGFE